MDESCSSKFSLNTPTLKFTNVDENEEDEDTLSPELMKMKIESQVNMDEAVPVKVRNLSSSSSSSSSSSTPKQKVATLKQPSVASFFQKKVPLAQTATPSISVDSSSPQSTVSNKDEVKPLDLTNTASTLLVELKSQQRQRRKSGVDRILDPTVDQTTITTKTTMKRYTKRITKNGKDYIQCTVNACGAEFVVTPKSGYSPLYRHHREIHGTLADAPYPCYYGDCGLRFTHRASWETHNKTHSKDKPFPCDHDGCDKRFKNQYQLSDHKNSVHSPELHRFVCTICKKRFYKFRHLQNHFYVHSEDKKIRCQICGIRVSTTWALVVHLNYHIEGKTKCQLCGLDCHPSNMKSHLAVHERNNKFFCSTCSIPFDCRNDIIDHYVTIDHIQKEKARLSELGIPRCVPIESKEEYHETMYFEPSDPDNSHYIPCERWKKNRKCKNCYCTGLLLYKAVYFKDKKWIIEGQVHCGQTMGVYLWDMVEMTEDELHPMDKFLLKHEENQYFDQEDDTDAYSYDDDDDDEEEEENEPLSSADEDEQKRVRLHYNYGGQYQSGFKNRTYSHLRGCDGKKAREFFMNPSLKKRCAALYGQPEDKKDPALVNLVETFVIDDFNLTRRIYTLVV